MTLLLRFWDDPALFTVCPPVDENEFGGVQLVSFGSALAAKMKDAKGVGLAACQVGVLKRVFCMFLDDNPIVICNPVLTLGGDVARDQEGCLSMPGVYIQIERAVDVNMRYNALDGKMHEITMSGLNARIAQHETDHLDGVFFIERVSRQVRRAALREWEKRKGEMK